MIIPVAERHVFNQHLQQLMESVETFTELAQDPTIPASGQAIFAEHARRGQLLVAAHQALVAGETVAFEGAFTETPDPPISGSLEAVESLDRHKVAAQHCASCGAPRIDAVVVTPAMRPVARYDLPVCHACADSKVEHGAIDRREATDSRAA